LIAIDVIISVVTIELYPLGCLLYLEIGTSPIDNDTQKNNLYSLFSFSPLFYNKKKIKIKIM